MHTCPGQLNIQRRRTEPAIDHRIITRTDPSIIKNKQRRGRVRRAAGANSETSDQLASVEHKRSAIGVVVSQRQILNKGKSSARQGQQTACSGCAASYHTIHRRKALVAVDCKNRRSGICGNRQALAVDRRDIQHRPGFRGIGLRNKQRAATPGNGSPTGDLCITVQRQRTASQQLHGRIRVGITEHQRTGRCGIITDPRRHIIHRCRQ